jgi:hypothetical protein
MGLLVQDYTPHIVKKKRFSSIVSIHSTILLAYARR